jgi:hypothetical protein
MAAKFMFKCAQILPAITLSILQKKQQKIHHQHSSVIAIAVSTNIVTLNAFRSILAAERQKLNIVLYLAGFNN